MADFNPDAYLAGSAAKPFDPDAYLGAKTPAQKTPLGPGWPSQKVGEGMLPGFNRVSALLQAATDPLVPGRQAEWGPTFGQRYMEHLRANQAQSGQAQAEHPYISAGLQTAGAVPTSVALGVPQAGLRGGMLAGSGAGAMYGAGETRSTGLPGMLGDTALGAGGGAVASMLPWAMLASENAGRSALRSVLPKINPTPAAQRLLAEGVPLTSGQMNPDSAFGLIEEAASHNPLGMQPERQAALESARNVALNRAVAPGAEPPKAGGIQDRLRAIYEGFGPVYDSIRDVPVSADVLKGMPQEATRMPGDIDAQTRAATKSAIENALTVLPGYKAPSAGGHHHGPASPEPAPLLDAFGRPIPPTPKDLPNVTAGDLMKVRENIRAEARVARKTQDFDRLRILGHAEDVVTGALEGALPPEQANLLRQTDRQYARFATMEDAASRGGPESEFSPRQLGAAVARSAGRRASTQGRAGDLQNLAQDMSSVFDQRVPPTGMRGVVLSGVPRVAFGPAARVLNLPGVQSGLMPGGSFALPYPQQAKPALMSVTPEAEMIARVLRNRVGLSLVPATAEEDRSR